MKDWIYEASSIAYGALNMKPWDFYKFTPGEFAQAIRGYGWRTDQSRQRDAWVMSNLVQIHTKKTIRPKMFYKPDKSFMDFDDTPENIDKTRRELDKLVDKSCAVKEADKASFERVWGKVKAKKNG